MKEPFKILIKPVVTEKATTGATNSAPQYTFEVAIDSNKIEVRKAVEKVFNVRVQAVNTIRMKGKKKRLRTAKAGFRRDWKKAIVTLEPGQVIELV